MVVRPTYLLKCQMLLVAFLSIQKGTFFFTRSYSGCATTAKLSIKKRKYEKKPSMDCVSLTFVGGMKLFIVSTSTGSGLIPSLPILNHRYKTDDCKKLHLDSFTLKLFSRKAVRTFLKFSKCSATFFPSTSTSSR